MAGLADLTDQAQQPTQPSVGTTNDSPGMAERIANRLFGLNGEERYQTWPEKLVRDALTPTPEWSVDQTTGDVHTSPEMIKQGVAASALGGTGGIAGVGETAPRLATSALKDASTEVIPKQFQAGTKDDTGIWFLGSDKPIYAQAQRSSLDKLYGDRAKEFDNYPSVSGTNDKGQPISVWYKPGEKNRAEAEVQNFKDKQNASTDAEKAQLHYQSGVNLGYPEEAARAYAFKRFGVDPNPPSSDMTLGSGILRVARKTPNGEIKIGKPGDIHSDLMSRKELNTESDSPEVASSMGYATPEGKFLTRDEALQFAIKNEPERAAWSAQQPQYGLDAATYHNNPVSNSVALGSGPFLRPALKYQGKIYKAPMRPDAQHLDAIPDSIYPEFQRQAMSGEDISNFNFGFMNHKGQFLNREDALDYAIKEGLLDKNSDAAKAGTLTSTLMSNPQVGLTSQMLANQEQK